MFSIALNGIIKDFYRKNLVKFDITIAVDFDNLKFASDVIQNVAKNWGPHSITISCIDGDQLDEINMMRSFTRNWWIFWEKSKQVENV